MVQVPLRDRIGGEVDLKAPVEEEAVQLIRAHPSTDAIRALEYDDLCATFRQYLCASKAGQAGPDNDCFHMLESVTLLPERDYCPVHT